MQRGLIIALGLSACSARCCSRRRRPCLRALHQPAEIVPDAAIVPAHLDRRHCCRISRSSCCDRAFRPCIASRRSCGRSIVANLTNAAFNWVFVYGHLGSPAMGVAGSAIATAISRWLMLLLLARARLARPAAADALRSVARVGSGRRCRRCSASVCRSARSRRSRRRVRRDRPAHGRARARSRWRRIRSRSRWPRSRSWCRSASASAAAVRVGHAIGAGDDARARARRFARRICAASAS